MKSLPFICTQSPSYGATLTAGSCVPATSEASQAERKYDGKVNFHDLRWFEDLGTLKEGAPVHLYAVFVWHVSLKRKLHVVVLVNRKGPHKPLSIVLASTDLELDGHKLVECYVARCQIEFLFHDSKQFTGLSDCQARAEAALDFHFNASLATLNLVRAEEVLASPDPSPQVFSMTSCKQWYFNERLLDVFIENLALDPTWIKINPVMTNSGLTARLPPDFVRTIVYELTQFCQKNFIG